MKTVPPLQAPTMPLSIEQQMLATLVQIRDHLATLVDWTVHQKAEETFKHKGKHK